MSGAGSGERGAGRVALCPRMGEASHGGLCGARRDDASASACAFPAHRLHCHCYPQIPLLLVLSIETALC